MAIILLPQLRNPAGLNCCLCMQSASIPSGLNNLGNTCYVNAALQGLFMIRGFREGLFAVEEPIADSPIVLHIRQAAGALTLLCATQQKVFRDALCVLLFRSAFRPDNGLLCCKKMTALCEARNVCRRLFAELQEGPKRSADPTCFAEALNLDRSIQQVSAP